jgi:hypothetical protein
MVAAARTKGEVSDSKNEGKDTPTSMVDGPSSSLL